MHAVPVDMAERAEIERAKGLHPVGRGLDDVARGVDLVVEHGEHAFAARLGRSGDAQGIDEVHSGVGTERARRALRPDQHHRLGDRQGQVQKKPGFLERRGAVRNDEPGKRRIVAGDPVDQRPQLDPLPGADLGAANLAKGHGHRIGDEPGLRKAVEQRFAAELLPEIGIVEHVEARCPDGRNRTAGADHRNAGEGCSRHRHQLLRCSAKHGLPIPRVTPSAMPCGMLRQKLRNFLSNNENAFMITKYRQPYQKNEPVPNARAKSACKSPCCLPQPSLLRWAGSWHLTI